MYQNKSDLVESFSNLESASFKKKIYDICMIFAMETNSTMSKSFDYVKYSPDLYYTIDDMINGKKSGKVGPPKKKRTPIRRKGAKKSEIPDAVDGGESKEEPIKKKNKSYPIMFNRNAKCLIDFIVSRFLWEIYSIESEDGYPETKDDLITFILEQAPTNFPQGNITELILNVVPVYRKSFRHKNTYDLDRLMRGKFDTHLNNSPVSNLAASYMVDFLKILSMTFANRFWLERSQTVNIKTFETVLRQLEFLIPVEAKTVSYGLMTDMIMYDRLVYPVKTAAEKKKDKEDKEKVKTKKLEEEKAKELEGDPENSKEKGSKKESSKKKGSKKESSKKKSSKKESSKKKGSKKVSKRRPKKELDDEADEGDEDEDADEDDEGDESNEDDNGEGDMIYENSD